MERATKAHYADGHAKSCSPCCAVEIGFIARAIKDAEIEALEWAMNLCEERYEALAGYAGSDIRIEIERRKKV
jgi:hypothetical protein